MEQGSKIDNTGRGLAPSASVAIMNFVCLISGILALLSAFIGRDSAPYAMSMVALSLIFMVTLVLNNVAKEATLTGRFVTAATTVWIMWMSIAFGSDLGEQNYLIIALIALLIFSKKGPVRTLSVISLIIIAVIINFYQGHYLPLFPVPDLVNVLFLVNVITPLGIVAFICWTVVEHVTKSHAVIELQKQQLFDSNQFKDKILSIVGHDMRTPFISAKSIIYLLDSDMLSDEERKAILKELQSNIDVSLQTLDNILGWASQGYYGSVLQAKTKNEQLIPYTMVQQTTAFFEHLAIQKMVRFDNKIDPAITLAADLEQISFVLRNVTNNALKFSHSGQTVTFTAKEQGDQVTVTIRDEGVGMAKETVDSLFQISTRFSQEGTTKEKGTGLGLIFCKEFIENNNGELVIESEVGAGTMVSFSLPKNSDR